MIKTLLKMLGRNTVEPLPRNPVPAAKRKQSPAADYRAVSLTQGSGHCAVAAAAQGKSFLLREAPRLPLAGCTQPEKCTCKFHKDSDRRDADRRLFGTTETQRWFAGPEARKKESRRSPTN
jgi:hypothetical protein